MKTGGKQAYFATARITDIIEDPSRANQFYALIDDFLPFDHSVPYKDADHFYESGGRRKLFPLDKPALTPRRRSPHPGA